MLANVWLHLIFIQFFFMGVHCPSQTRLHRSSGKCKRPFSQWRRAVDVGKDRERVIENKQVKDRGSAESDQYSNCKLNLTGARTSHQMGKEIGYER